MYFTQDFTRDLVVGLCGYTTLILLIGVLLGKFVF